MDRSAPLPDRDGRRELSGHLGLLVLLTLAVFANTLANGFVWDDIPFLLDQPAYRQGDLLAFFRGLGNGLEYQPLRDLSYALDFALWGGRVAGFHATNLLLYLANVVAVYLLAKTLAATLARRIDGPPPAATVAFWTAALFALHPLHSEVASFISGGRNTLLASLFAFLASRAFVIFAWGDDRHGYRQLASSLAWYLLALLSKSTVVSLPVFFLAVCLLAPRRSATVRLASLLPFMLMAGAASVAFSRIAATAGIIEPNWLHVTLNTRLAVISQIPAFYLGKFAYPFGLVADYGNALATSLAAPITILSLLVIGFGSAVAVYCRHRAPAVPVAAAWFLATLLPVMQLVLTPMQVADRYAYLPSFGLCFLLAWLGCIAGRRWRTAVVVAGCLLLVAWGTLSARQNRFWRDTRTLWTRTVALAPSGTRALTNLGTEYFVAGDYATAFDLFARARQLDPYDPTYDFFNGHLAMVRSDFPAARRSFQLALARKPDLMDALFDLGTICETTGDIPGAIGYYRRVLASRDMDRGGYRQQAAERLRQLGVPGRD